MNFSYDNIKFKKENEGTGLLMFGEVTNNTGRSYHSVVFRVVIFIKTISVANIVVTVNGFAIGQTKTFEHRFEDLEYKIIPEITRYEMYAESAY